MALIDLFPAPANERRDARQRSDSAPRTRGLLGRLTAEQKQAAYSFEGSINCGPPGAESC